MNDDRNIIHNKQYIKDVCQIHQGQKTCKYIMFCNGHFRCVKNTLVQSGIDEYSSKQLMKAKGDNCEGLIKGDSNGKK